MPVLWPFNKRLSMMLWGLKATAVVRYTAMLTSLMLRRISQLRFIGLTQHLNLNPAEIRDLKNVFYDFEAPEKNKSIAS
jgi:hypothetical protein